MDAEPPTWGLSEHLSASERAVLGIAAQADSAPGPQPICHHFSEVEPVDVMTVSRADTYAHLGSQFEGLGLEFLSDRLEAWETAHPDGGWIAARIPAVFDLAQQSGLIYEGWTWEPPKRQPIGAATFQVINNRADAAGIWD